MYAIRSYYDLGNTEVYASSGGAAKRLAIPVTFTENGKISSLSIYHDGGTGSVLMGVYSSYNFV